MSTLDTLAGHFSLGRDVNKRKVDEQEPMEGIVSEKRPELSLEMKDEDILKLTKKWQRKWNDSPERSDWLKQGEENEKYWLGKHFNKSQLDSTRPIMDNAIFEALETYLPQVTRRNPEPVVQLHSSEKRNEYEEDPQGRKIKEDFVVKVKNRLADIADENVIRLKLKKTARHWALFLIGTIKVGWNLDTDMP